MAVKPQFNDRLVRRVLQEQAAQLGKAITRTYQYVGESFVRNARENGDYNDITGNLRASIGFGVFYNGEEVVSGGFEGSAIGAATGRSYMLSLATRHNKGYALIVVAGMEYGAAVESRGRDVLTGSGITARNELESLLEGIRK